MAVKTLLFTDQAAWLDALARDFHRLAGEAVAERGALHVALAGGATPRPFYQRLNRESLPLEKIEWWLGDERWVPPSDPSSNARMVRESLGRNLPASRFHLHAWPDTGGPAEAARRYAEEMNARIGKPPILDLALLGLGEDGHTASLFPDTPALDERERDTAVGQGPPPNVIRLTLTYPALDRARAVWFLVSGDGKSAMVDRLLRRDIALPAARVAAAKQRIFWLRG